MAGAHIRMSTRPVPPETPIWEREDVDDDELDTFSRSFLKSSYLEHGDALKRKAQEEILRQRREDGAAMDKHVGVSWRDGVYTDELIRSISLALPAKQKEEIIVDKLIAYGYDVSTVGDDDMIHYLLGEEFMGESSDPYLLRKCYPPLSTDLSVGGMPPHFVAFLYLYVVLPRRWSINLKRQQARTAARERRSPGIQKKKAASNSPVAHHPSRQKLLKILKRK